MYLQTDAYRRMRLLQEIQYLGFIQQWYHFGSIEYE